MFVPWSHRKIVKLLGVVGFAPSWYIFRRAPRVPHPCNDVSKRDDVMLQLELLYTALLVLRTSDYNAASMAQLYCCDV